jgi:hypothetical protein
MKKLWEGFECGDLQRVLQPKIHLDEFESKIGKDDNVIVISFLINDRQAAIDLVDFFERGYDFILDADISDSEITPGSYLVFVEVLRRQIAIEQIFRLLSDLSAASRLNLNDWNFKYMNDESYHSVTAKNLKQFVPLGPGAYHRKLDKPIDDIKQLSGLQTESNITKDDLITKLMFNAGIPL